VDSHIHTLSLELDSNSLDCLCPSIRHRGQEFKQRSALDLVLCRIRDPIRQVEEDFTLHVRRDPLRVHHMRKQMRGLNSVLGNRTPLFIVRLERRAIVLVATLGRKAIQQVHETDHVQDSLLCALTRERNELLQQDKKEQNISNCEKTQ